MESRDSLHGSSEEERGRETDQRGEGKEKCDEDEGMSKEGRGKDGNNHLTVGIESRAQKAISYRF